MNAFEPLFWLLCAWIAIRIVKGASPRLWLLFGAIAGLGLENKHSMLVFGFALVAGLLFSGQAQLFRSKWIWIGGAVALAIFLPNLLWEVAPRLAANRSSAQRPAVQERGDQPAAIPVRAGSVSSAAGAARVACRPALVFRGARREALPLSGLGLSCSCSPFSSASTENPITRCRFIRC